jgi:dihydrofolate reductase
MTKISMIAAMDQNRVIGQQNKLPWHLPADLQHFKQLTLGKPIIMGRKTYESIGKPLPQRTNVIITHNQHYRVAGCQVMHSIKDAITTFAAEPELMVIGGTTIFEQCLPLAQTLYLTLIQHSFAGDTYFPQWNPTQWLEIEHQECAPDKMNPYPYRFSTLVRR